MNKQGEGLVIIIKETPFLYYVVYSGLTSTYQPRQALKLHRHCFMADTKIWLLKLTFIHVIFIMLQPHSHFFFINKSGEISHPEASNVLKNFVKILVKKANYLNKYQ